MHLLYQKMTKKVNILSFLCYTSTYIKISISILKLNVFHKKQTFRVKNSVKSIKNIIKVKRIKKNLKL